MCNSREGQQQQQQHGTTHYPGALLSLSLSLLFLTHSKLIVPYFTPPPPSAAIDPNNNNDHIELETKLLKLHDDH